VTVHKRGVLGVKIRQIDVSTGAVKVRNYNNPLPQRRKGEKRIRKVLKFFRKDIRESGVPQNNFRQ
jgi:hypothetical protein